jgi:hypothetical protein
LAQKGAYNGVEVESLILLLCNLSQPAEPLLRRYLLGDGLLDGRDKISLYQ